MKCLNRIDMQLYIDNEFSPEKRAEVYNHLQSCNHCNDLFNEATTEKQDVLNLLSYCDEENAACNIPEFKIAVKKYKINRFQVLRIAASVIIVFGLYFTLHEKAEYNKKPVNPLNSGFESIDNSDPNKKWHKKQMEIIITDANGNIEESFISEN